MKTILLTATGRDLAGHQTSIQIPYKVDDGSGLDVWTRPFTGGIWNTRIGQNAQWDPRPFWAPPATTINNVAVDPDVADTDPSYPLVPAYSYNRAKYGDNPLADLAPVSLGFGLRTQQLTLITDDSWDQNTPNAAGMLLDANGMFRSFNYGFHLIAANGQHRVYIGSLRGTLDPLGDGLEFDRGKAAWGGHGGSMLPIGGTIRPGELWSPNPIPHPLALTGWMKGFGRRQPSGENDHVWPAFTHDKPGVIPGGYGTVAFAGAQPIIPMGGLVSITPDIDIATIGLETQPGMQMARAAQQYGIYLTDEVGSAGWVSQLWNMAWGVVEEAALHGVYLGGTNQGHPPKGNPFARDTDRILGACRLVTNNGPTSIGGGGSPAGRALST